MHNDCSLGSAIGSGESRTEILFNWHVLTARPMSLPNVQQAARRIFIFAKFPFPLAGSRKMVLARRHNRHFDATTNRQCFLEELQIFLKGVVPTASFPGNRPTCL